MCNFILFPPLNFLVISSGVHTSDIITVYISAIKALRHLDPSMVILQVACQPIRKYLRLAKTSSYLSSHHRPHPVRANYTVKYSTLPIWCGCSVSSG